MSRAVIIHGWNATPDSLWFPWLRKELEANGFSVQVPRMPGNPPTMKWVSFISEITGKPDEDLYMIGHSAGCITILRYLETTDRQIGGAVLVSGFSDDLGLEELADFFRTPVDWGKIRQNCRQFVSINSDNDGYIPIEQGYRFRDMLGAELIIEKGQGHFTKILEFPAVLNAILKMPAKKK